MKVFHAFAQQYFHHVHCNTGRYQIARGLVVIQPFVHFRQPCRNFDVGNFRHFAQLLEVGNGQDARYDFGVDTHHHAAVAETQIALHVKEKLCDDMIRTCIDFAFQID